MPFLPLRVPRLAGGNDLKPKKNRQAEQDRTSLTKRVQDIETSLIKKEELRILAQQKLEKALETKDDSQR